MTVFTKNDFPEWWAAVNNNLGNVYLEKLAGVTAQNYEEAINFYFQSCEVYSEDKFPEKWANVQQNLGYAFRDRIKYDNS